MLDITRLDYKQIVRLLDWLEEDICMDVVIKGAIEERARFIGRLVDERDEKNADLIRGEIKRINKFLDLHDNLLQLKEQLRTENDPKQES